MDNIIIIFYTHAMYILCVELRLEIKGIKKPA